MKFLFLLVTLLSILLYGVVGKDKTFLLAPSFIITNSLIFIWLLKIFIKNRQSNFNTNNKTILNSIYLPKDVLFWFLFFLYASFLFFTSSIQYESKSEIIYLSCVLGSFLFWRNELSRLKYKQSLFTIFLIFMLILSLYGLINHFKFPDMILWSSRYTNTYFGRLSSSYICPNHFAHLLQMILPYCVCYLFLKKGSFFIKTLSAYSLIIFLICLFLTESRAGWLGSIASFGSLILIFAFIKSKKLFFLTLILVPLLTSSLFFFSWKTSETFQRRMAPVVEFLEGQIANGVGSEAKDFRPLTWYDSVEMIKDKPLFGFGPKTYHYCFQEYRDSFKDPMIVTGHPHNEYLELLADYGIFGFILFGLAWMYSLFRVSKNLSSNIDLKYKLMSIATFSMMLGTMVHSFFDFQMHIYPNALVFSMLLPLGMQAPSEKVHKNIIKKQTFLILLLVCFVMLMVALQSMTSLFLNSLSQKYFLKYNYGNQKSLYLAQKSQEIDKGNWRSSKLIGSILNNNRYYSLDYDRKVDIAKQELEAFRYAFSINQFDAEVQVGIAKALIFLGNNKKDYHMVKEGIDYLYNAASLKKFNNKYWWLLASELRKNNYLKDSLKIFDQMDNYKLKDSIRANINWIERNLKNNDIKTDKIDNFNNVNFNNFDILDYLRNKK